MNHKKVIILLSTLPSLIAFASWTDSNTYNMRFASISIAFSLATDSTGFAPRAWSFKALPTPSTVLRSTKLPMWQAPPAVRLLSPCSDRQLMLFVSFKLLPNPKELSRRGMWGHCSNFGTRCWLGEGWWFIMWMDLFTYVFTFFK